MIWCKQISIFLKWFHIHLKFSHDKIGGTSLWERLFINCDRIGFQPSGNKRRPKKFQKAHKCKCRSKQYITKNVGEYSYNFVLRKALLSVMQQVKSIKKITRVRYFYMQLNLKTWIGKILATYKRLL